MRPLVTRIDSAALAHNLMLVRQLAGQSRELAVVKANGHGIERVARALRAADGFAAFSLDEATVLRGLSYSQNIARAKAFGQSGLCTMICFTR